ncbi:hypothetical protein AB0393_07205 [Streptomyces cyaneofuscatus]
MGTALQRSQSSNLAKIRIDPGQQTDLAQALVNELGITLGDD